jgi:aldose 1-epimerase
MNHKQIITAGDWSAMVDLARGANCISLQNRRFNASILREPPLNGNLDNPYLYGMPILFPVNRIEGGCFDFEGRIYTFPINEPQTGCHLHGELHQTAFELLEKREERIVCRYAAKKGEYLGFPHAFEILQAYELREEGLFHTVTVRNLSEQSMPVLLGFHTTFNTLFTPKSDPRSISVFADITEEYERNMSINYLPTGVKPPFDETSAALASGTYKPFAGKASRHYRANGIMSITDAQNCLRIVYENDGKYAFRLIYNGGDEGYICLEPQNCLANCPNAPFSREEAGFDALHAGEDRTYRSKIILEEI